jgi:hypothetical protein
MAHSPTASRSAAPARRRKHHVAKIIPGNLAPDAVPRVRGQIIGRVTKRGIVVQKWPRKRPEKPSPGVRYARAEFALAASWASDPEPVMYQTAIEYAKGTDLVPRDLLMMAIYGTYYTFTLPNGATPTFYRMVAANAQLTLDQVTSTVGAMLVRTAVGWVEVLPGNDGQYLGHQTGVPKWQNVQLASGGAANIPAPFIAHNDIYMTPGCQSNTTFANIATNANQLWLIPLTIPWLINTTKMAVSLAVASGTPGATGRLAIYGLRPTDGQPTVPLIDAGTIPITATGLITKAIVAILPPGTYWAAWWVSHNCSPRGVAGGTGVAGIGVSMTATSVGPRQMLRNTITYAAAWPDLTNVTMTLGNNTDGYPMIGIK